MEIKISHVKYITEVKGFISQSTELIFGTRNLINGLGHCTPSQHITLDFSKCEEKANAARNSEQEVLCTTELRPTFQLN